MIIPENNVVMWGGGGLKGDPLWVLNIPGPPLGSRRKYTGFLLQKD